MAVSGNFGKFATLFLARKAALVGSHHSYPPARPWKKCEAAGSRLRPSLEIERVPPNDRRSSLFLLPRACYRGSLHSVRRRVGKGRWSRSSRRHIRASKRAFLGSDSNGTKSDAARISKIIRSHLRELRLLLNFFPLTQWAQPFSPHHLFNVETIFSIRVDVRISRR
jgi:hypothetical protein